MQGVAFFEGGAAGAVVPRERILYRFLRLVVYGPGFMVEAFWFRGYGLCFGFEAMGLLVHDLWFMILG
jgi:hypothetical protein